MITYKLKSGDIVTAKDPDWPTQYVNRTQAQKAADKIPGAEVIQRGRPFYVRLPTFAPVMEWEAPMRPVGPAHDPFLKLLGTVLIAGVPFHAEAYEVEYDEEKGTIGKQDDNETYVEEILNILQGSARMITLGDREYLLAITPYQH